MSKQNIGNYNIPDGEIVIIKGKVAFGRIGEQTISTASKFPGQQPKWQMSLVDPEVVRGSESIKSFVENELYTDGKGDNAGHKMIYVDSSAPNAPLVFDAKTASKKGVPADKALLNANGTIGSIASGTEVEIALSTFTSKTYKRQSIGLQGILVDDINNIPRFGASSSTMTIKDFGIEPKNDDAPELVNGGASAPAEEAATDTPDEAPQSDANPFANNNSNNPFA